VDLYRKNITGDLHNFVQHLQLERLLLLFFICVCILDWFSISFELKEIILSFDFSLKKKWVISLALLEEWVIIAWGKKDFFLHAYHDTLVKNEWEYEAWHNCIFTFRNMPWYWPFGKDSVSSETYSYDNPTLIEGISDDTILLVLFTLSLIGLWIYYSR
jgi:hypothetical protein